MPNSAAVIWKVGHTSRSVTLLTEASCILWSDQFFKNFLEIILSKCGSKQEFACAPPLGRAFFVTSVHFGREICFRLSSFPAEKDILMLVH